MNHYGKMLLPAIEKVYHNLTSVEKNIADFFLTNKERTELSSKSIAKRLYVSEASLSRFAKKCGFKGFREFLFYYENAVDVTCKDMNTLLKSVLNDYQELLDQTAELVDEKQMKRVAQSLTACSKVYVYGVGSSGIAASEFKLRFMRLGVSVEAISDVHIIRMNSVLVDENTTVIGISLSGRTQEVLEALRISRERGGHTVLLTGGKGDYTQYCDEILHLAITENLEYGTIISPQFPILVLIDIFYACFIHIDLDIKSAIHSDTVSLLMDRLPE